MIKNFVTVQKGEDMPQNDVPKVKCDNCVAILPLADFIERPDLEDVFVSE